MWRDKCRLFSKDCGTCIFEYFHAFSTYIDDYKYTDFSHLDELCSRSRISRKNMYWVAFLGDYFFNHGKSTWVLLSPSFIDQQSEDFFSSSEFL